MSKFSPEKNIQINAYLEAYLGAFIEWRKIRETNPKINPTTKGSLNQMFIFGLSNPQVLLNSFDDLDHRISELNKAICEQAESSIARVSELQTALGESSTTTKFPTVLSLLNDKSLIKTHNNLLLTDAGSSNDEKSHLNKISPPNKLAFMLLTSYTNAVNRKFRNMHTGVKNEDFLELLTHSLRDVY